MGADPHLPPAIAREMFACLAKTDSNVVQKPKMRVQRRCLAWIPIKLPLTLFRTVAYLYVMYDTWSFYLLEIVKSGKGNSKQFCPVNHQGKQVEKDRGRMSATPSICELFIHFYYSKT